MIRLAALIGIVFFIWLLVGLLIYFAYGRNHSIIYLNENPLNCSLFYSLEDFLYIIIHSTHKKIEIITTMKYISL